jgi:2-polyprenyl-3-methyl-5-hydroxy-6-metoxy-1,4-benzoquinol methylase
MPPNEWNREYAEGVWDRLNDAREVAHYAVQAALVSHFSALDRILDVACGEGILQRYLKPWGYGQYLGIDKSQAAIEKATARQDARTRFQVADAEAFTPPHMFTCIAFSECLYYFADPKHMVDQYSLWLTDGGILVTSIYASHESENLAIGTNHLKILEETTVTNARGAWKCTAFSKASHAQQASS